MKWGHMVSEDTISELSIGVASMASDSDLTEMVKDLTDRLKATEDTQKVLAANSDQFFLIVIAIIIFFMQCGFAFLEAGSVR